MYSLSANLNLTLADSTFLCNSSLVGQDIQDLLDSSDPDYMYEGSFYISKALIISSTKNTYKMCGTTS